MIMQRKGKYNEGEIDGSGWSEGGGDGGGGGKFTLTASAEWRSAGGRT